MSARCIAGSAFAARWSGRARRRRCRRRPIATRWTISAAHNGNLGSHPDRRRSADAVAAAAGRDHGGPRRHRSRQDRPHPHPRARGGAGAHRRATWSRRCASTGATTWVAVHANHPRELSDEARAACARLADAGIPLVSQTVLLRGVNDDAAVLEALMRAFVECRIKPYYLHHGDLAPGTAHLRTTIARGPGTDAPACGAASPACASRIMCSIFPAATERRRSARIICRMQIPGNVNYPRKRGIVSSTIAATFISIRQSRDRR